MDDSASPSLQTLSPALVPSQVAPASSRRPYSSRRPRRRKPRQPPQTATAAADANQNDGGTIGGGGDSIRDSMSPDDGSRNDSQQHQQQQQRKTRNQRRRQAKSIAKEAESGTINETKQKSDNTGGNRTKKQHPKGPPKKRYPWRRYIPPGSVDPITLDPLVALPYPPFALVATEPYEPLPEWPPKELVDPPSDKSTRPVLTEEERQRRILEEQWGEKLKLSDANELVEQQVVPAKRHYNLYDGRALAYYLVSQLQFIDPLNRRDLTRDELINLDDYLRRHGFEDTAKVVEAYDAKGITLSTAGAAANTAAGRAEILQQQAAVLLNALFGGGSRTPASHRSARDQSRSNTTTSQQRNASTERPQRPNQPRLQELNARPPNQNFSMMNEMDDTGIYGDDDGGILIIDDDINPALRGGIPPVDYEASNRQDHATNTLWSASHLRNHFGNGANIAAEYFPPLSVAAAAAGASTTPAPAQTNHTGPATQPARGTQSSATLNIIGKVVKPTDPEEIQRQREAREEALKKAMLSSLSFGPSFADDSALPARGIEGQLERNRAFAEALGVVPATVRNNPFHSGWARPSEGKIELDEFGNELNVAQYPDSFILQARERMGLVLRLEKKWKTFLADDTAASMPLPPMDRPTRTFVHEYSDFWRLKTESFDPEPRRYIHCVKLRDTCAPSPLLSTAVSNWRGPTANTIVNNADNTSLQTAGQSSNQGPREFPAPPTRVPLPLKPRSTNASGTEGVVAPVDNTSIRRADTPPQASSRFDALFEGRERPRLELTPRTRPLELPPFQPFKEAEEREMRQERLAAKARRDREAEERRRRILEAQFASSDEEVSVRTARSSSSSEWEERVALYTGGDSE